MTTNEIMHFIQNSGMFDITAHFNDARVGKSATAVMPNLGDIYMQQEKDAWLTGEDPVGLSDWGKWAQG